MPRKLPRNQPFLHVVLQQNLPQKLSQISRKTGHFSMSLTLKNRRNLTFFHDLSEALTLEWTGPQNPYIDLSKLSIYQHGNFLH